MFRRSPGFVIRLLFSGMAVLATGLTACVTVPKDPQAEEVLVSLLFVGHHDSVCLSADFNGWSSESHCLRRNGDDWSIQVALPPGTYRYGFVIDQKDWAFDPEALIQEEDGFGKRNSVLFIDPGVTKRLSAP